MLGMASRVTALGNWTFLDKRESEIMVYLS
jgi:hypothetical protein